MATDCTGEGYFFSAIKSFRTHTAFANAMNDHIVSWANSSLRWGEDLPKLEGSANDPPKTGILLEDPLSCAFREEDWNAITR